MSSPCGIHTVDAPDWNPHGKALRWILLSLNSARKSTQERAFQNLLSGLVSITHNTEIDNCKHTQTFESSMCSEFRSSCFRLKLRLKPTFDFYRRTDYRPQLMLKFSNAEFLKFRISDCTNLKSRKPRWSIIRMVSFGFYRTSYPEDQEIRGLFVVRISYGALKLKFWTPTHLMTHCADFLADSQPFLLSWLISFLMITNYCFQYFHLFIRRVSLYFRSLFFAGLSTERFYERYPERSYGSSPLDPVLIVQPPVTVIYLPYHLNYETVLAF